jgi:FMN-dependent NADH-azoreductase
MSCASRGIPHALEVNDNFADPYLRSVFGFLGVTDATFLTAGGTSVLN